MTTVTVAIVGSREFPKLTQVDDRVHLLRDSWADNAQGRRLRVVSGGARGVDGRVRYACGFWGVHFEEFPADWSKGKSAGYERNQQLVEMAEQVIAFWDGESRGTKHSIDLALRLRKNLEVHFP